MEVLIALRKDSRSTVLAELHKLGFARLSGYEAGVGEIVHIHGDIPDGGYDSIRGINGVANVEITEDYDSYE